MAGDDQLLVGGVSREGVERYGCEESGSESLFRLVSPTHTLARMHTHVCTRPVVYCIAKFAQVSPLCNTHTHTMFCSDDEEIETGASPSTLTQEIDSALDRMMSSGGRGQTSVSGEEFPAENLQGWAHYTTPGTVPVCKSYI